jgi:post-segregation antitoxin (ccd killing protein)
MAAKQYPVQVLIYVTQEQADALHAMTTNVSAWVRSKIDREIRRTQTQEQRRAAAKSEATK